MLIDIAGKINNTQLPISVPLLPLYEAIINSIEAIEDAKTTNGRIDIFIKREQDGLKDRDGTILDSIVGFEIKDNGIGFTEDNFTSFKTSDSTYKVNKGGKGVGRFLWLKAFDSVEVDSIYKDEDKLKERHFTFVAENDGIKASSVKSVRNMATKDTYTSVRLCNFRSQYQKYCPKKSDTIAAHIIEYCLEFFLRPYCPQICLYDDISEAMNLNDYFEGDVLAKERMEFDVNGNKFWGTSVRLRSSYATDHFIHYCADNRIVKSEKLSGRIPNLHKKIEDEQGSSFYYAAYIESDLLNQSVNSERTNFVLPQEPVGELFELSWQSISEVALEQCARFLQPYTDPIRRSRIREINNYIVEKAPIYRSLSKYITERVDTMKADADERQLELEIYRVYQDIQYELKEESQAIQECSEFDSLDEYQKASRGYFQKVVDINKSDLARYVCDRKAVLDYMQTQLEIQQGGEFATENVIHNIIFPMGHTSDEVGIDDHNLWLLDEKLVYHKYLASDKPLASVEVLECDSRKEPDILILNTYDKACAFSDSDPSSFTSIVLVEFKRPMRRGYSDSDNPFTQLMNYMDDINSGKAKSASGRFISAMSQSIPYFCYIVGDIDNTLKKIAGRYGMTLTPDGCGFFGFIKDYNAYFEVISYDKMVSDARKRNKILFDKLSL